MLAIPRSPFAQSPGGILNRTWVKPSPLRRSRSAAAEKSYGNRNSTPSNPARRAAAKRSRNGTSLNIIDRVAARRGMSGSPSPFGIYDSSQTAGTDALLSARPKHATTDSGLHPGDDPAGTPAGRTLQASDKLG